MHTSHSQTRCQQRGIRSDVLNVLLTYGRRKVRHGAEVCFMDKISRARAREEMGPKQYARIADRLNSYIVVSEDGQLITAAPRLHRLKF
jgi:hypothetical protein